MPLHDYHTKRDFKRTPEPTGKERRPTSVLHFVVQKHHASHLHYDFRLELGGVLKSWAVPKGPSLSPDDKRLAMMVEDHPFEYRTFEGVIPKGNYGAGEVIIWDEGVYSSPETSDKKESEKLLRKGLAKGHLSFVLYGQRLKGLFSLVKLGNSDNGWLLIKQADDFSSVEPVTDFTTSVTTGRTIEELGPHDREWHSTPKTFPGHHIKPMLAMTADKPFDHPDWLFEIKWDGYRAIAEIEDHQVAFYSRKGLSFVNDYPAIAKDLTKIKHDVVLDGEIVVLDEQGRSQFQLLQHYAERPIGALLYYAFDILRFEGNDVMNLDLLHRKELLSNVLPTLEHIRVSEHVIEQGTALYEAAVANGAEGIMGKKTDSLYRPGIRSQSWLKIKHQKRQEAVIGGFTEPRGGRKGLGALLLGVYEGSNFIYIGHTGGGIDDAELGELRKMLEPFERKTCPFKKKPVPNAPVHWVEPRFTCEVKFSEWTEGGSMRQPIFLGLRDDRTPQTVHHEKTLAPEKLFLTSQNEKQAIIVDDKQLTITNMSKVLWPELGYTKQDLLDYYQKIAPYILPYLKNRPESLHRHPHGIHGESFFQKNASEETPSWILRERVYSDSEERPIDYLICNDTATLLYLINLGCIELNVWNASVPTLDYPDYLVIDLDPGEISFEAVIKAAQTTKSVLDAIHVPAYCKTSGKTGLHIYVPLDPVYTHDQVKGFAELLMRLVHQELPDITSLERSPAKRFDKVYLDFLQNRRGQTMAAPYCLRPVPEATISTPLLWKEVKKGLTPKKFTIKTIFKRLGKHGDIWKDLFSDRANLKNALEKISHL